jgi:cytochrome c556
MPNIRSSTIGISLVASAALLVGLTSGVDAQRRRGADNSTFGSPVATNTIVDAPDQYFGKLVTITAGVERMVSKTTFLVDQQKVAGPRDVKAVGKPILVIAPYLTSSLDPKKYFLVRGQVVKLEPSALARLAPDYVLDLPEELGAKYMGQPVLVASSVLNSTYVEMARKPIPPPTKSDVALTAAMKTISPAFNALRTAAQGSKADEVKTNLAVIAPAFAQAESVLGDLRHAAAAQATEARAQVASIETALTAGNWDAVKSSAAALNQTCQSCHAAHREPQDDGTFRIKTP